MIKHNIDNRQQKTSFIEKEFNQYMYLRSLHLFKYLSWVRASIILYQVISKQYYTPILLRNKMMVHVQLKICKNSYCAYLSNVNIYLIEQYSRFGKEWNQNRCRDIQWVLQLCNFLPEILNSFFHCILFFMQALQLLRRFLTLLFKLFDLTFHSR